MSTNSDYNTKSISSIKGLFHCYSTINKNILSKVVSKQTYTNGIKIIAFEANKSSDIGDMPIKNTTNMGLPAVLSKRIPLTLPNDLNHILGKAK